MRKGGRQNFEIILLAPCVVRKPEASVNGIKLDRAEATLSQKGHCSSQKAEGFFQVSSFKSKEKN